MVDKILKRNYLGAHFPTTTAQPLIPIISTDTEAIRSTSSGRAFVVELRVSGNKMCTHKGRLDGRIFSLNRVSKSKSSC